MRGDKRTLKNIFASESVSQWVSETTKIKDGLQEKKREKEKEKRERVKEKCKLHII